MSVSVTQQKQFIGGEFVDSTSGETMEVLNPATGEVIAEVPRGTAEDVERAVTAAKKAWDEWQGKTPKDRMELLLEACRRHRRERRGARAAGVAQRRQAVVGRRRRARRDVRQPPLLRRRCAQPRGQGRDRVRRGLHVDDPARAARHRRRDLPLELPALHGDVEGRTGAGGRQRPDHQAGRADAAHDAPFRRAGAGGHPARRTAGRHRRRHPRGRRARPRSAHPPRLADGRHGDREDHREERRGHGQACPPRARREGADGRARRRRSRDRRRGDQDRRLLQLRPGLHRLVAHPRQREDLRRRALGHGRGRRIDDRGRPRNRRRDRHGAGHLRRAAGAHPRLPRARDRRQGHDRHGRRGGRRPRLLRLTDARHRRRSESGDRPERGLRAGRDHAVRGVGRRGDRDGERRSLRPRGIGLLRERRTGDEGRGEARLRDRVDQRAPLPAHLGDAARGVQGVGLREGHVHLLDGGVHAHQACLREAR